MAQDRSGELSDGQQMLLWILCIVGTAVLFAILRPHLLSLWQVAAVWHAETLSRVDHSAIGHAFYSAIGASGDHLGKLGQALASRDSSGFSGDLVWRVSEYIGKVLRWFLAPPLILLAWDVLSYPRRYRRHFGNGAGLFRYVQATFGRYLARVENAINADLYQGPHAVAKTEWRWATENKCVRPDDSLDEERALVALRSQLGTLFTTWNALIKGKNGWIAREILGYLGSNSDREGVIAYAVRGHRYESTVLVALLLAARRFGVVPCMTFAGLRKIDRPLWYALESAGRRLAFVEAAGIMAQYEHEMALLAAGKGEHRPHEGQVQAAIAGLKSALETEAKDQSSRALADRGVWANYDPTK